MLTMRLGILENSDTLQVIRVAFCDSPKLSVWHRLLHVAIRWIVLTPLYGLVYFVGASPFFLSGRETLNGEVLVLADFTGTFVFLLLPLCSIGVLIESYMNLVGRPRAQTTWVILTGMTLTVMPWGCLSVVGVG